MKGKAMGISRRELQYRSEPVGRAIGGNGTACGVPRYIVSGRWSQFSNPVLIHWAVAYGVIAWNSSSRNSQVFQLKVPIQILTIFDHILKTWVLFSLYPPYLFCSWRSVPFLCIPQVVFLHWAICRYMLDVLTRQEKSLTFGVFDSILWEWQRDGEF